MKLQEYLDSRGESQAAFSRRIGVNQRTINRICAGEGCMVDTVYLIIMATRADPAPGGGTVTLEDLVTARGYDKARKVAA